MSIYTKQQLIDELEHKNESDLRRILNVLIVRNTSETVHNRFVRAIKNPSHLSDKSVFCHITSKKSISFSDVRKLASSPFFTKHLTSIVTVAVDSIGPLMSRDVLMKAVPSDQRNLYIDGDGVIKREPKVLIGYILQIAGFEFKSRHFESEGKWGKAWALTDLKGLSIDERVQHVRETVFSFISKHDNSLESFI